MQESKRLKKIVMTGMLAALAGVLMSLEISLPFMPPFYKLDFSDVPSIVALFAFGPLSGVAVEVIKILVKLVTVGTNTAYVGEFANLIGVAIFILPLWGIYRRMNYSNKGIKTAFIISVPVRIAFACAVNAFITLPLYAKAMNISLDTAILAVGEANTLITGLPSFIVLATIPFNLLKITLNYVAVYYMYQRLVKANVFERRVKNV